jgi:hypothetical protein
MEAVCPSTTSVSSYKTSVKTRKNPVWRINIYRNVENAQVKVKVKVTLRLTVSQSVCLGVEPNLGLLTRIFFLPSKLQSCLFGALSLTRGRVCHVSVFVIVVYNRQSLFTLIIYIKLNNYIVLHTFTIKYNIYNIYRLRSVQALYSRLCMPYLLGITAVLHTWTVVHMTVVKFEPLIIGKRRRTSKSKSKSHYDWRSVSQYVLVSSPNLGLLTRYFFFPKLLSCLFFGEPSLTRGRVCHVSVFVIEVYNSQ